MSWEALLVSILPQLLTLAPQFIAVWDRTASSNALVKVAAVVQQTPIASVLAEIGAIEFPKLAPELHAAAAALAHTHFNNTAYMQDGLNIVESTGYINFGPALVVDGDWGPKTRAAVEALQTKLGMPVNGFIADAEYAALNALLAKV